MIHVFCIVLFKNQAVSKPIHRFSICDNDRRVVFSKPSVQVSVRWGSASLDSLVGIVSWLAFGSLQI